MVALADLSARQREAWGDLAAEAAEPNPFFEPDAVLEAAALLPQGEGAAVALVEGDGEALLALPVLRRRRPSRVPVPALVAWHHPYVHAGAPLVRAGRERAAWAELLDHLRHAGQEHWLVMDRLPLLGPSAVALQRELAARHLVATDAHRWGRPVLRRRSAPTYLDGRLSSRARKTLRRQRRRLADELGGEVSVVDRVHGAATCDEALDVFLSLEDGGWKGRAGTALLRRPADAEWFRRTCRRLHEQGRLEVWVLGSPERAAAAQVNARAGRTLFHLRTAYDESLAAWSPGMQLEVEMVGTFHADDRVDVLDACVDPGNRVSAQLYPDRELLGSLAVPLRQPAGPAAVAAWALLRRVRTAQATRAEEEAA